MGISIASVPMIVPLTATGTTAHAAGTPSEGGYDPKSVSTTVSAMLPFIASVYALARLVR